MSSSVTASTPVAPRARRSLPARLKAAVRHPGGFFRYRSNRLRAGYHYAARFLHVRTFLSRCVPSALGGDAGPFAMDPRRGYALVPPGPGSPVDTTDVVREVRALVAATDIAAVRAHAKKPYLLTLLDGQDVSRDSPIFRFVTAEPIVSSVAQYLGCLPVLTYIAVWYSPNDSTKDDGSQKFHLDHEDFRQVKGFVFIDDVEDTSGPFTLLEAEASAGVQRAVNYRMTPAEKRVEDDVVFGIADRRRAVSLTGPAGTVALVDTSRCFHYGSRAGRRPRIMLAFQYITPFAFVMPWRWQAHASLKHLWDDRAPERERKLVGMTL